MKKFFIVLLSLMLTFSVVHPMPVHADDIPAETEVPKTQAERLAAAEAVIEELVAGWDKEASQYIRIRTIYDWICQNIRYDINVLSVVQSKEDELYYAMVEKRAVCDGYAIVFNRLAGEMGIESITLLGQSYSLVHEALAPHAWNLVKLGDYWYMCDSTWDAKTGYPYYFLKPTLENHYLWGEYKTEEFWEAYPQTDKNFSIKHDCTFRTEITEATCTENATEKEICRLCGEYTLTITGEPLGHDIVKQEEKGSTCIVHGNTEFFQCTRCKTPYKDEKGDHEITDESHLLPFADHSFGEYEERTPSTCIEKGEAVRICAVCKEEESKELELGPHTPILDPGTEATCTATGLTDGEICDVCKKVLTAKEIIPKKEHSYDNYVQTVAPTCITRGKEVGKCTGCGKEDVRTLELTDHTPVVVKGHEATCVETGITDGEKCDVCGTYLVYHTHIPVKGHSFGEYVQTKAPTCISKGTEARECSVCGKKESRYIDETDHTPVVVKGYEATCIKYGLTDGEKCGVCGSLLVPQTTIPMKGHSFGEYVRTVEPTCAKTGTEVRRCSGCGMEESRTIEKLPHTPVITNGFEATCTKAGLTSGKKCDVCGEVIVKQTEISPKGHSYTDYVTVQNATCTKPGTEERECRVCGNSQQREIGMLPHQIKLIPGYAATPTSPGLTDGEYCETCKQTITEQVMIPTLGKKEPSAPVVPELVEKTSHSICVTTRYGHEYSLDKVNWQADGYFDDLADNREYRVYSRRMETETHMASGISEPLVVYITCEPRVAYGNCPGKAFADLMADSWYHLDTDYVITHGLMNGVSDDSFAPDKTTTRAMIVTILYRMSGETATDEMLDDCNFADVSEGRYYADAVAWAKAKGVVKGVSDSRFDPDAAITREQMVTMLYRYADYKGYQFTVTTELNGFIDGNTVSSWASKEMKWAVASGLINGVASEGKTTLQPQSQTSRVQAAAFIHRLCDLMELQAR